MSTPMTAKQSKKIYTAAYWHGAKGLPRATFGPGSAVADRYAQGYQAGVDAFAAGRAQRTMVWSTRRGGMPLVKVTRTVLTGAEVATEAAA